MVNPLYSANCFGIPEILPKSSASKHAIRIVNSVDSGQTPQSY